MNQSTSGACGDTWPEPARPKSPRALCGGFGTSTSTLAAATASAAGSKSVNTSAFTSKNGALPSSGKARTIPPAVSSGGSPSSL